MQNKVFRGRFLRQHWRLVGVILILAFTVRFAFVIVAPPAGGDSKYRYIPTAVNILDGNGFSLDASAPHQPSEATMPLYPLFIAAAYAAFGRHDGAVKVVQIFIDLVSCLLVAFVSFNLAPTWLKNLAATAALIIYGIFSWFIAVWTARVLTETLAIFLTMLVIVLCIKAIRHGQNGRKKQREDWYWAGAGLCCGLAILTRPDSLLLMSAVVIFLMLRSARRPSWKNALGIACFCLTVVVTLLPWIVRNYVAFGKFQPLASEYGFAQPAYMPTGYLEWLRTWITDETYFENVFNPAFAPTGEVFFDPEKLPAVAFDSAEEKERVIKLIAWYNENRLFTSEIDGEFRSIANDRIKRLPARYYVALPIRRVASVWLTGFSTRHPTPYMLAFRILSVLPILIGGLLSFGLWGGRTPAGLLLLLIIGVRTAFLGYHYAPETRYIVEAYPPVVALCGVTAAAVWQWSLQRRQKIYPKRAGLHSF